MQRKLLSHGLSPLQTVTRDMLRDDAVASAFQIDSASTLNSLKIAALRPVDMDGAAPDVLISSGQSLLPLPVCCGGTCGGTLYLTHRASDVLSFLFVSFL